MRSASLFPFSSINAPGLSSRLAKQGLLGLLKVVDLAIDQVVLDGHEVGLVLGIVVLALAQEVALLDGDVGLWLLLAAGLPVHGCKAASPMRL